jgi:competence protein ComEC
VVENFHVGLVLDPGVSHPSPSYTRLLRLVEAGRIPYRAAREGTSVDLGAGVRLTVLYPPEVPPAMDGDPVHGRGVVARLAYGLSGVLLTGDAEAPVEQYLLERGAPIASQVLKVGHHGSRTSTTPAFVAGVRPQVAIISTGAGNPFGHPHPVTLATLHGFGVPVYRTDHHGAIRLVIDGTAVRVRTFRDAGARLH